MNLCLASNVSLVILALANEIGQLSCRVTDWSNGPFAKGLISFFLLVYIWFTYLYGLTEHVLKIMLQSVPLRLVLHVGYFFMNTRNENDVAVTIMSSKSRCPPVAVFFLCVPTYFGFWPFKKKGLELECWMIIGATFCLNSIDIL